MRQPTLMLLHACDEDAHNVCPGWSTRSAAAGREILVCRCVCGHRPAQYLLERGVLNAPPGWTPGEMSELLDHLDRR